MVELGDNIQSDVALQNQFKYIRIKDSVTGYDYLFVFLLNTVKVKPDIFQEHVAILRRNDLPHLVNTAFTQSSKS